MKSVSVRSFVGVLVGALLAFGMSMPAHAMAPQSAQGAVFHSATRTGPAVLAAPDHSTRLEILAEGAEVVLVHYQVVQEGQIPAEDDVAKTAAHFDEVASNWIVDLGNDGGVNARSSRWVIQGIQLFDPESNSVLVTDRAVLDPLGFSYVNPLYDGEPPVLESITVEPEVALPGQEIRITVRLRDASKSQRPVFGLTSGSASAERDRPVGPLAESSVDEGNGITAFTQTYMSNEATEYGTYAVGQVYLRDLHWNYATVDVDAVVKIEDLQHPVGTGAVTGKMMAGNSLTATANWPQGPTMSFKWTYGEWRSEIATGAIHSLTGPQPAGQLGLTVIGTWPDQTVRTRHMSLGAVAEGKLGVGAVSITGNTKVGSRLAAVHRALDPGLNEYTAAARQRYTWMRDGARIDYANGKTYVSTAEDIGHFISVRVDSSANGYADESTTSPGVKVIGVLAAGVPSISGAAGIGSKFTANLGTWTPGTRFTYQWLRNGKPIPGATAKTYTSTKADLNQVLQVKVAGTNPSYTTVAKSSAAKRPVTGKFVAAVPVIGGSARVGSKLSVVVPAPWVPKTTPKYQWLRNGKAIKGATSISYVPVTADLRAKLSVRVTAAKTGYSTMVRSSGAKTIAYGKLKEGTAKMTGTFKVGSAVKIHPTGWAAGNTYHYQWTANGARLKDATSKTYKLRRADKGKAIECVVTVKRPGYATISVSSGTRGVR